MYNHSSIYKLQCSDGSFYIGSTTNELRVRFSGHKTKSKTRTSRVYQHINTIGWNEVRIILIEAFSCNSKLELLKKEDEYIQRELDNEFCLNTLSAYRTDEQIVERQNVYDLSHKDEKAVYRLTHKSENKAYRLIHKDELIEYRKAHKVEINERRRIKYLQSHIVQKKV